MQEQVRLIVENGPSFGGPKNSVSAELGGFGDAEDDIFGGDVSSIMIKPDLILNDQNIAHE